MQNLCGAARKAGGFARPLPSMMTSSPGFDVAHEIGADDIECAGFAGQHIGIVDFAEHQRPHAVRIAHADDACSWQAQRANKRLRSGASASISRSITTAAARHRHQMDDHFGIGGRAEQAAALDQLFAQAYRRW